MPRPSPHEKGHRSRRRDPHGPGRAGPFDPGPCPLARTCWRAARPRQRPRRQPGPCTRPVTCHVGSVWHVDGTVWRTIAWEPRPEPDDVVAVDRLLPAFRGELGLRGDAEPALILRGAYTPPAGRLGGVADSAALHRIAHATAERLLTDVVRKLESVARPAVAAAPPSAGRSASTEP